MQKFKKGFRYFLDYYKWYAIAPTLIIIIIVSFILSYKENTRPISLSIALVNTNNVSAAMAAFQYDYPKVRGIDTNALPVKVETNLIHPSVINEQTVIDESMVANVQRLQALMISEMVDVFIGTDWVVRDYEKSDVFYDMHDVLSAEDFEKYKDDICYMPDSNGNLAPVAIYLADCPYLEEFHEQAVPVIAIPLNATRPEQAKDFVNWIIQYKK